MLATFRFVADVITNYQFQNLIRVSPKGETPYFQRTNENSKRIILDSESCDRVDKFFQTRD